MPPFVQTLVWISLFRASPKDVPVSANLLLVSAGASFAVFLVRNTLLNDGGNAAAIALIQVILLALFLRILVGLFSKSERWLQSATALLGCSALIVGLIVPLLLVAGGDFASDGLTVVKLAVIITSVWYFAMMVYVIRETLEVRLAVGFIITLMFELSMASVLFRLFGDRML